MADRALDLLGVRTPGRRSRVCVVGSGTTFLSGISVYTYRLALALARRYDVSVILMRRLLPARFYPGRSRVGANLTELDYAGIPVFDGVDWYGIPSIVRALAFLIRERPDTVIFQWWCAAVLHSYFVLAIATRLLGAQVVIEFHEVFDTGEMRLWWVRLYVRTLAPLMMRLASGFTTHTDTGRELLRSRYRFGTRPMAVVPHGPHDHYKLIRTPRPERSAPADACNLLFFGVIRPFKGLEDLVRAFDALLEHEIDRYWLTVVGETWEGWTLPNMLIANSRYRHRITFVNRYVHDHEVAAFFANADAVVLPYHRSMSSGPLHAAMGYGLPVVVTRLPSLVEAVANYAGAVLVPARDPEAIRSGIRQVAALRGNPFAHPHPWEDTAESYRALLAALSGRLIDTQAASR